LKNIDEISHDVIGAAMQIHRDLGPGMLESVYEVILEKMLHYLGYRADRQVPIDVDYAGLRLSRAFKIDLLVENQVVIEIKSVENLHASHAKQLLTYLRLANKPLGLLINFGEPTLLKGLKRLVNGHTVSAPFANSASLRELDDMNPSKV
jgi:GxxExxY protein